MTIRTLFAASATAALLLTTSGCGGDADQQKAIDSLAAKTDAAESGGNPNQLLGEGFGACYAEKLVKGAGIDQLVADGVLDRDHRALVGFADLPTLSEKSATAHADAEYACIDWPAVTSYLQDSGSVGADDGAVQDYVDCMQAIDPDVWRASSRAQVQGKDTSAAVTSFNDASQKCQATLTS